jgi:peroxiredoxin
VRTELEALGVEVVAVTPEPFSSNANWRALNDLRYEVWSDASVVLFAHYMVSQNENETRLLDDEGNVVLVYDTDMISLDVEGHANLVLEDVQLLWGDAAR